MNALTASPDAPPGPSLRLDARQRAMLAEMGVRVWLPGAPGVQPPNAIVSRATHASGASVSARFSQKTSAPSSAPRPAQSIPLGQVPAAEPAAPPAPLASADAPLDSAALRARIQACQACVQGQQRLQAVIAADWRPAHWLVLGDAPDAAQARAGQPFIGEAGALLDAMLRAVAARRDASEPAERAHLSLAIKCAPARPHSLEADALSACRAHLDAEIALVRPRVLLALGPWAIRTLLTDTLAGQRLAMSALRGRLWAYRGVPVVVSYPLHHLLGQPKDKRAAWDDLKLARRVVDAPDWAAQVLAQPPAS